MSEWWLNSTPTYNLQFNTAITMNKPTIETYIGQGIVPAPVIPRSVCGITSSQEAPMELKGPLILFSSGLDSTYLVREALKTSNVHLLYVMGNFNRAKAEQELAAREKIKQWFNDNPESQYRIISDTIQQFEMGDSFQMINAVKLSQPLMWLYPAMYYYKPGLHTSVQIAYVKNDHMSPHLDDLTNAWNILTKFIKAGQIPLTFPVRDVDKKDSYNALPKDLRSLIWVCDNPMIDGNRNIIECKQCGPCKRRATYLNQEST